MNLRAGFAVLFLALIFDTNPSFSQQSGPVKSVYFEIKTTASSDLSTRKEYYLNGSLIFVIYEDQNDFYGEYLNKGIKRIVRKPSDITQEERAEPAISAFFQHFNRAYEARLNRDKLFLANYEKLKSKWPLGYSYLEELNDYHYLKFYLGHDTQETNAWSDAVALTFHEVFHRKAEKMRVAYANGKRRLLWTTPNGPNHLFEIYLPRSKMPSLAVLRKYIKEVNDTDLTSLASSYLSKIKVDLNMMDSLFEEALAYSVEYDVRRRFSVNDLTVKTSTYHGALLLELGLKYLQILSETQPELYEKVHTAEVKAVFESIYRDLRSYYERTEDPAFTRAQELARSLGYF